MQRETSKEFQRGVGRARALLRQGFAHWPGAPLLGPGDTIRWCHWSEHSSSYQMTCVDGDHLRELESRLSRLIHHHRDHLSRLLPNAEGWLLRASNCLELLKEFLHKPPSAQSAWSTIERMTIAARWKRKLVELGGQWPKLQPLLWNLAFYELTAQTTGNLECLAWLEINAQPLSDLMNREDGVQLGFLLSRVGPHCDPRWLNTIFNFLNDTLLARTPVADIFTYADQLAQCLRVRLDNKPKDRPARPNGQSLSEKFIEQLQSLVKLRPSEIGKITRLLGAVVGDQLCPLVLALNRRSQAEEKRLTKELLKVEQLGVQYYTESIGKSVAQSRAHVVTNLREEARSFVSLFQLSKWLMEHPQYAGRLQPVAQFFGYVEQLKVANRIHLAAEWLAANFLLIARLLPIINELFERRGVHGQLNRHWLRRFWPSIVAQESHNELLVTGVRCNDMSGWRRTVKLLEGLVYDRAERLTEAAVSAIVKLGHAVPSYEVGLKFWQKLSVEALAGMELNAIREAFWYTQEVDELRMALAWFSLHPDVARRSFFIRSCVGNPEYLGLLRRLVSKRNGATIQRWGEYLELLSSYNVCLPERPAESPLLDWMHRYPPAFHPMLRRLQGSCGNAEAIAHHVLGGDCQRDEQVSSEIEELTRRLALADDQQESRQRKERIEKRIENLKRRLSEPFELSESRQAKLIQKLGDRLDRELLGQIATLAKETLQSKLGWTQTDGLDERLKQPPYDRIMPALAKLNASDRELASRALSSSWDNSLKLLNEPANERFLQRMSERGLKLDAWVSSELSLEGRRANGVSYRIAFTQDPLEILLMGHHFHTCLSLDGMNFFSTVSNLVDANKRVVYGHTSDGEIVGRCLFTLTSQGKLKTFTRYQRDSSDGFDQLVDEFALKLVAAMGTSLTETGNVPCLVSRAWYDDGCMPLPTSIGGKTNRLNHLLVEQRESDPWELALQVFETKAELIVAIKTFHEYGLFYNQSLVLALLLHFVQERDLALSLRLRMAAIARDAGRTELAHSVFEGVTDREIYRSLGRDTLHDLILQEGFARLVIERDPYLARQLLRRSRRSGVRTDEQETDKMRCYMRDQIALALSWGG